MQLLKKLKYIIIILTIFVVALYLYIAFLMMGNKIAKNVYIICIYLTKEEAVAKVNADVKLQDLTLIYGKHKFSKDFDEIGFKYSVDKAVNEAFSVAKSINFFDNISTLIKLNMGERKDIKLSYE